MKWSQVASLTDKSYNTAFDALHSLFSIKNGEEARKKYGDFKFNLYIVKDPSRITEKISDHKLQCSYSMMKDTIASLAFDHYCDTRESKSVAEVLKTYKIIPDFIESTNPDQEIYFEMKLRVNSPHVSIYTSKGAPVCYGEFRI